MYSLGMASVLIEVAATGFSDMVGSFFSVNKVGFWEANVLFDLELVKFEGVAVIGR